MLAHMNVDNCLGLLFHPKIANHDSLVLELMQFCGDNFGELVARPQSRTQFLKQVPKKEQIGIIRSACAKAMTSIQAEAVLEFCLEYAGVKSLVDLVADSKEWPWGASALAGSTWSPMRTPEAAEEDAGVEEWLVPELADEEAEPECCVVGDLFDWHVRLDHGGGQGKLRIVYEEALPPPHAGQEACIRRFPAATFTWRACYRGQEVLLEKPTSVCLPEEVSLLRWSTDLPFLAKDAQEDDELLLSGCVTENPLLSLILYYFSCNDLENPKIPREDILNNLPNLEFRCLASYSMIQQHANGEATH